MYTKIRSDYRITCQKISSWLVPFACLVQTLHTPSAEHHNLKFFPEQYRIVVPLERLIQFHGLYIRFLQINSNTSQCLLQINTKTFSFLKANQYTYYFTVLYVRVCVCVFLLAFKTTNPFSRNSVRTLPGC